MVSADNRRQTGFRSGFGRAIDTFSRLDEFFAQHTVLRAQPSPPIPSPGERERQLYGRTIANLDEKESPNLGRTINGRKGARFLAGLNRLKTASAKYSQSPCVVVGNLDIVRPLAMAGLSVVLATSKANRPAFSSRLCLEKYEVPGPTRYPDAFIDTLIEIGRELQSCKPVLFYSGDTDLIAISRRREELSPYFRFHLPSHELVDQLTDKTRFARLAEQLELETPKTMVYYPGTPFSSESMKYPCIIKPAVRGTWLGSEIIRELGKPYKALHLDSAADLEALLPRLDSSSDAFVIQELVPGGEENIVSYHSYVDRAGRTLGEFTGRKIRTFPIDYGVSSSVVVEDNEDVKRFGRGVIERIGLRGVSKTDIKIDARTGQMKLLEINPRFSLWNHPGARAGVNLEALAYRDIAGEADIQAQQVVRRVKWVNFRLDAQSYLEMHSIGALSFRSWSRTLRGPKVYTLWSWNDPAPFLQYGLKSGLDIVRRGIIRHARRDLRKALAKRFRVMAGRR